MQTLKYEVSDNVGILTVNRPESMNALNSTVLQELSGFLESLAERNSSSFEATTTKAYGEYVEEEQRRKSSNSVLPEGVRAVVLTGAGEKAFVAGADIKELSELDESGAREFAKIGQEVFRKIETSPIPIIAAVNGFALGGGLELAMSCDFILASSSAKLGLPEVTLGLMPGFGGTVRMARLIGLNRTRELIYSGRFLSAEEAQQWGLVNTCYPAEELLPAATKLAKKIADLAPIAVSEMKSSVQKSFDEDIDQAMLTEREAFARLFNSEDQREGTRAFIEKRKPEFKGR